MREVQTITTSTYIGPNEIQSLTSYARRINEVQFVRSYATAHVPEMQKVIVSGATGGYFFLELDTSAQGGSLQYSGYIYVNYPAAGSRASVQQIVSEMSNVNTYGPVTVTYSIIDAASYEYFVSFPEAMGDIPQMKVGSALMDAPTSFYPFLYSNIYVRYLTCISP